MDKNGIHEDPFDFPEAFLEAEETPAPPVAAKKRGPRLGLVLGSSGVRAFAALPLLQLLSAQKIPVDLVVGCSGGGFLAALWGAGFDMKHIERVLYSVFKSDVSMQVDPKSLMRMAGDRLGSFAQTSGLYKPQGLRKACDIIFKDMLLEDLSPKTTLYATDVNSGEGHPLEAGRVADAVMACGSLYPIMPPVRINGRLLADGSYFSPLPVMEAVKRDVDVIVAVFLQDVINPKPTNFLECYMNIVSIAMRSLMRSQLFGSIGLHHYEIVIVQVPFDRNVQLWEVEAMPEILTSAKRACLDALPAIKDALKNFNKVGKA
ncbi:MAG: patatin-like phospholipase family protein [Desulfovibrionaceae bacterium]|jgi:NTE family protein|nr:patatin-like phospholipase family protein [Desulfovibrionaceae bacterium]